MTPPIAFMGGVDPLVLNRICAINPDGSGFTEVTSNNWQAAIWASPTSLLAISQDSSETLHLVQTTGTSTPLPNSPRFWGSVKMSLSPDGSQAAGAVGTSVFTRSASAITIVNLPGGGPVTYLPADPDGICIDADESGSCVAWSPDGTKFAYTSTLPASNAVKTCNVDGSNIQTILYDPDGIVYWSVMDWWPDGGALLVSAANYNTGLTQIIKCAPDGSGQSVIFTDTDGSIWGFANPAMALSPDGESIVVPAFLDDILCTVPSSGGSLTEIYSHASGLLGAPDWYRPRAPSTIAAGVQTAGIIARAGVLGVEATAVNLAT